MKKYKDIIKSKSDMKGNSISLINLTNENINNLISNHNTGIEYEFAIAFHLLKGLDHESSSRFLQNVIKKHPKSKIIESYIGLCCTILDDTKISNLVYKDVLITTQDDSFGPSDIVIVQSDCSPHGLSIKHENSCNVNISSKYFISQKDISMLRDMLPKTIDTYINEMSKEYGNSSKWFRKRKKSKTTDHFIQIVIDKVIDNWEINAYKEQIISKIFHYDSPIDYWIITIRNNKNGVYFDIDDKPKQLINALDVTLHQTSGSFIEFRINDDSFAKMQVKFNNGILEKYSPQNNYVNRNTYIICVDNIHMKMGDPFGSWNISLIQ